MKKIIIAATVLIATAISPSYTKQVSVKSSATFEQPGASSFKKDVGTAD
jgi:hypothetical protein